MKAHLQCDMSSACTASATHIDNSGYVYCEPHAIARRAWKPCRKMTKRERDIAATGRVGGLKL